MRRFSLLFAAMALCLTVGCTTVSSTKIDPPQPVVVAKADTTTSSASPVTPAATVTPVAPVAPVAPVEPIEPISKVEIVSSPSAATPSETTQPTRQPAPSMRVGKTTPQSPLAPPSPIGPTDAKEAAEAAPKVVPAATMPGTEPVAPLVEVPPVMAEKVADNAREAARPKSLIDTMQAEGMTVEEAKPITSEPPLEKPFLWRVEGFTNPIYLYGTIHAPDARVLSLPKGVLDAIDRCDVLYTEIPLDASSQMAMGPRVLLQDGKKLYDVIEPQLYERLGKILKKRGYPTSMMDPMKPWAAGMTLQALDLMKQMSERPVLDAYLPQLAMEKGKGTGALETAEEQIHVFEQFNEREQTLMLESSIEMFEDPDQEDPLEKMLVMYVRGDLEAFTAYFEEEMKKGAEKDADFSKRFMEAILYHRNELMVERLLKIANEQPDKSHFFAVGTGHYPGDRGILDLLQKQGYKVTRLGADGQPVS